ncbi:universal stress protein [Crocosphaera chwakensis]|uniref:Universal stress protein n=1 Tax=Crocosphaera chwakensis CCY0110 TaxID=391612 RepID=A3IPV0_9CHRO|nr:universal stress protein [Crocosphaera chwakensis]EAZ91590.1 universal stress protein family [Crocosphaera chwakensis CCY0110]
MYSKILVAVDNSAIAEQVIEVALTLCKAIEGKLMLVNVLSQNAEDSPISFAPYASSYSIDLIEKFKSDWKQYQQESLQKLEAWTQKAKDMNIQAELRQENGNPGPIICRLAKEWEAELIVIGRRGHSMASEIILGSVSSYVIHRSHCSVHIVQS